MSKLRNFLGENGHAVMNSGINSWSQRSPFLEVPDIGCVLAFNQSPGQKQLLGKLDGKVSVSNTDAGISIAFSATNCLSGFLIKNDMVRSARFRTLVVADSETKPALSLVSFEGEDVNHELRVPDSELIIGLFVAATLGKMASLHARHEVAELI